MIGMALILALTPAQGFLSNPSDKLQPFDCFPHRLIVFLLVMAKILAWLEAFRLDIIGKLAELFMARKLTLIILAVEAERMAFFKRQTHICRWAMAAYTIFYNESANYFGSLRARLGITFDRLLFYATAGSATGGTRGSATLRLLPSGWTLPYTAPQSGTTHAKYITGLGLEYAFTDQVSARFEYMFLNQSFSNQYLITHNQNIFYVSRIHNENNVFRFGVNKLLGDENIAKKTRYYGPDEEAKKKLYSFHILETNVVQGYPKFYAKYSGTNSFPPSGEVRNGSTTDLFAGLRLWPGASIYVNPEVNAGYAVGTGVGNVVGCRHVSKFCFHTRNLWSAISSFYALFLRQSIGLGGGSEAAQTDSGVRSVLLEDTEGQVARRVR
jgi:high affinity Mn2+ porin